MDWKRRTKRHMAQLCAAIGLLAAAIVPLRVAAQPDGVAVEVSAERQNLGRNDDVLVTVTLTNRSATMQYLLAWQTPFDGVQAALFDVTRDGQPVPYLGIQAKRAAPTAADYIALAPGASRAARVELSALYDMRVTGAYSVRYRAGQPQLFSAPGVPHAASAATEPGFPAAIWIDGRLPRGTLPTLPVPIGAAGLAYHRCSNAQQASIAGAVRAARAMAADADADIGQPAPGARYTTWFGAADGMRAQAVAQHMRAIRDAFAGKPVTVDCGCSASYYAYVYANQPYRIHVCDAFWNAPLSGTDSKGGALVQAMSHFTVVAGTGDWVYGQAAAADLALTDPARAIDNADSHEYFGENTPPRQ